MRRDRASHDVTVKATHGFLRQPYRSEADSSGDAKRPAYALSPACSVGGFGTRVGDRQRLRCKPTFLPHHRPSDHWDRTLTEAAGNDGTVGQADINDT